MCVLVAMTTPFEKKTVCRRFHFWNSYFFLYFEMANIGFGFGLQYIPLLEFTASRIDAPLLDILTLDIFFGQSQELNVNT